MRQYARYFFSFTTGAYLREELTCDQARTAYSQARTEQVKQSKNGALAGSPSEGPVRVKFGGRRVGSGGLCTPP
jgi:hypothetical protein